MIIKHKIANLTSFDVAGRNVDVVSIEWYEANKRILHKKSKSGKDVVMKFMSESQALTEGDVLWQDEITVLVIAIETCEVVVIRPASMFEMASVCYEIGNKHLPLFYAEDEILVPFEEPLFKLLAAAGYQPAREKRKLINPLKTTVSPHANTESKQSLFSKILQLTTSGADV
jgi:urease accessory protein